MAVKSARRWMLRIRSAIPFLLVSRLALVRSSFCTSDCVSRRSVSCCARAPATPLTLPADPSCAASSSYLALRASNSAPASGCERTALNCCSRSSKVARLDVHFGLVVRVVVTVVVTTVPGTVVPSVVAAFTGFGPSSGGIAGEPAEVVVVALDPMSGVTGVGAGAPAFGWFTGVTTPAGAGAAATVVVLLVVLLVVAAFAVAVSASLARRRNCMLIHASAEAGTFTL